MSRPFPASGGMIQSPPSCTGHNRNLYHYERDRAVDIGSELRNRFEQQGGPPSLISLFRPVIYSSPTTTASNGTPSSTSSRFLFEDVVSPTIDSPMTVQASLSSYQHSPDGRGSLIHILDSALDISSSSIIDKVEDDADTHLFYPITATARTRTDEQYGQ